MISLTHVGFAYSTATGPVRALDDVSVEVRPGEIVCVVGANGSGKSTLALMCNGLLLPRDGVVEVDGMDTREPDSTWDVRSRVGLVLQHPDDQIVGTSVETDAAFGPENLGVPPPEIAERVAWALGVVGLDELREREPHLLSEGQKQRLAIAGALAMRPRYLVLDEPTAMLDPVGRQEVADVVGRLVRDEDTGVLHITHRLEELVLADRVIALVDGAVALVGTPTELLADAALMEACAVEPPPVWRMARGLREVGFDIPVEALDAEAIVEALTC